MRRALFDHRFIVRTKYLFVPFWPKTKRFGCHKLHVVKRGRWAMMGTMCHPCGRNRTFYTTWCDRWDVLIGLRQTVNDMREIQRWVWKNIQMVRSLLTRVEEPRRPFGCKGRIMSSVLMLIVWKRDSSPPDLCVKQKWTKSKSGELMSDRIAARI